jgi:hypothetical protein
MVALFASVFLLFGTWATLRGGFAGSGPGLKISGFDPNALGLGAVAIAAAIWFFGWQYGLAFIGAIMLHEYGHVAAYRVCGHADAQFRLIPLLGGVSISARIPSSHLADLFITLMGAAGGIAPMMLLFAASDHCRTIFISKPRSSAFWVRSICCRSGRWMAGESFGC